MDTYRRHQFPPEIISNPWPISTVILAGLYENPEILSGRYIETTVPQRGPTPGEKLLIHPAKLTKSTRVMWWTGLGRMAGVGFVEGDGLFGGF